jgi:hypothetical protein
VHLFKHTKHCTYNSKFTPVEAQHNPKVKTWFICKQESKLADIDLSPFKGYKEGDYLLVHMPYREINYKRRGTFNELAIFRGYRGVTYWLSCVFLQLNLNIVKLSIHCMYYLCGVQSM